MATIYVGGTQVKSGTYMDASSLAFVNVEKDGGALPGGAETRWRRVPGMLLVAAAPVLGGLFVIALPIIGFGAAAYAIGRKLTGHARAGAKEIAATVAPPWAAGEAHLTGKPPEAGADGAAPAQDERMRELEKEIGKRRNPAE
ncbi:MAG TPA: hypothetical protein VIH11_06980 [Gemmatimonadaceae bacterium]